MTKSDKDYANSFIHYVNKVGKILDELRKITDSSGEVMLKNMTSTDEDEAIRLRTIMKEGYSVFNRVEARINGLREEGRILFCETDNFARL